MPKRLVDDGTPATGTAWERSSLGRLSRERPGLALVLASLAAAAFATAWMLLQHPNFYLGYDFLRMHSLYKGYLRQAVASGRFPLWNPHIGLGRPFMADLETATLYPPSYLVVPFGVQGGVALSVLLHLALAIYGGVRLGRVLGCSSCAGWLLGAGLALSGPFSGRLEAGMVEGFFSLCWWPVLLALGAELQDGWGSRRAVGLALAVALAILAGHPPILFVEFLGLALFLALRQEWPGDPSARRAALGRLGGVVVAGALGAGLASAQLLPFLELVRQGNRPIHEDGFATESGMLPLSWPFIIVPASGTLDPNWEQNLHCGLVPFLAAVGGLFQWRDRNIRSFMGLGAVGAVMAAGDHTPFLGWILHLVPGGEALRLPSRYGIWTALAVLAVAALALSRPARRPALAFLAGIAACGFALVVLAPYAGGSEARFLSAYSAPALAAGVLVYLWGRRDAFPALALPAASLMALLCAADWLLAIRWQAPLYALSSFSSYEESTRALLGQEGLLTPGTAPPRISFYPGDIREDAGMAGGFSTFNSYAAPDLGRVWNYIHVATGSSLSSVDFIQLPVSVYDRVSRLDGINLAAVVGRDSHRLALVAHPDPRAYLAFDSVQAPGWREAEAHMAAGWDFHATPVVEAASDPHYARQKADPRGTARITGFAPEAVRLRVSADAPALLVLAEAWYPGWTARVDGSPAGVFPVNGWMRGTLVPAGEHEVVMEFHQDFLGLGLCLSAASALALAAMGLLAPRGQAVSRIL